MRWEQKDVRHPSDVKRDAISRWQLACVFIVVLSLKILRPPGLEDSDALCFNIISGDLIYTRFKSVDKEREENELYRRTCDAHTCRQGTQEA